VLIPESLFPTVFALLDSSTMILHQIANPAPKNAPPATVLTVLHAQTIASTRLLALASMGTSTHQKPAPSAQISVFNAPKPRINAYPAKLTEACLLVIVLKATLKMAAIHA
jgi:hypothetical protein